MDTDPIPPSSVSTTGSNPQVSSMLPRHAKISSLSDLIEIMKIQMVTDAAERKAKCEQMQFDRGREDRGKEGS